MVNFFGIFRISFLKKSNLDSWSTGLSYNKNNCFTSLTTNKLNSVSLSTTYNVNSALTLGTSSEHAKANLLKKFTIGGSYFEPKLGLIKGKIDSDGLIGGALIRNVDSKTKLVVTPSIEVNGKDLGSFKWGVGITIG